MQSITNQVDVNSFCEQFASLYHRNCGHNRQNGYFFMVYVHCVDTIDTKVRGGRTSCQLLINRFWVRVPGRSSTLKEPPTDDVERFLAMLRFDSREKLKELPNLNLDV